MPVPVSVHTLQLEGQAEGRGEGGGRVVVVVMDGGGVMFQVTRCSMFSWDFNECLIGSFSSNF